jgi:uroporphyrinogen III methyltransferase/synthase
VDTLVFLMGVGRLEEIARRLTENGRAADTPVAVVEWGTLPRQRVVTGTLATIAADVRDAGVGSPAVTVVGEVARLRQSLRWFDTRPLFGKRVLVTRTRQQASELSRALAAQGAEPVELPTLEIVPSYDAAALAAAIGDLRTAAYGWIVFTSANAVELFDGHLRDAGLDSRAYGRARIAAIGPGTAEALAAVGLRADLVPERYVAESLLEAFAVRAMRGQRVLLPRAEGAREVLVDGLAALGARVDELTLYRSDVPANPAAEGLRRLREGEIDVVTFASSSSVRNLIEMLGGTETATPLLRRVRIAAIGPVTAQAVREAGLEPTVVAQEYTIEGLVEAVVGIA